tara:strand:+ start:593 stop:925 length:333 start_codon:yes stop_codon:yes gene_type:complete
MYLRRKHAMKKYRSDTPRSLKETMQEGGTFDKGTQIKVRNCMDPNIVCSDEEHDLYDKMKNRMETQRRANAGDSQALNYLQNNPVRMGKGGSSAPGKMLMQGKQGKRRVL